MRLVTPEATRLKRQYGADWRTKAVREFHADVVVLFPEDLQIVQSETDADAV